MERGISGMPARVTVASALMVSVARSAVPSPVMVMGDPLIRKSLQEARLFFNEMFMDMVLKSVMDSLFAASLLETD